MYDVNEVATFFISKDSSMSHKKLQKLMYYAYGWCLYILNDSPDFLSKRLFNDRIEAWVHGPVIPSLYRDYKSHSWSMTYLTSYNAEHFDKMTLEILEQVWQVYGNFSADELEMFTHKSTPWKKARQGLRYDEPSNNCLSDKDIFQYFSKQAE